MTYNIRGPGGNIYAVLGMFQSVVRQLEKAGLDTIKHKQLLKDYTSMSYDEILDAIEKITNGTVRFTGRNQTEEDEEDEG